MNGNARVYMWLTISAGVKGGHVAVSGSANTYTTGGCDMMSGGNAWYPWDSDMQSRSGR